MIDIKQELLDFIDDLNRRETNLNTLIYEATQQNTKVLKEIIQASENQIRHLEQELDRALMVDKLRESGELRERDAQIAQLQKLLKEEILNNKYAPWVPDEREVWANQFMELLIKASPM